MRDNILKIWFEATRNHGRRMFVLGLTIGAVIMYAAQASTSQGNLAHHVLVLEHACASVDTGGGVTQCAQPTREDSALRACLMNDSYIGTTQEDTRHLLVQCMDDWQQR